MSTSDISATQHLLDNVPRSLCRAVAERFQLLAWTVGLTASLCRDKQVSRITVLLLPSPHRNSNQLWLEEVPFVSWTNRDERWHIVRAAMNCVMQSTWTVLSPSWEDGFKTRVSNRRARATVQAIRRDVTKNTMSVSDRMNEPSKQAGAGCDR